MAPAHPFLEAVHIAHPAAIIVGAPLDLTECVRSGTAEAPGRIREASQVLESYSPMLQADLHNLPLTDWGNVTFAADDMDGALAAIADIVDEAIGSGLPLLLGGEHTATVGGVRGALRHHPSLQVIHVDAHTDLRDEYEGLRMSHATVMRRVADEVGLDRIAQFGIRSGTRDEFEVARRCLCSTSALHVERAVLDRIHTRPVYLTIDIDVLDPSCAPGTGCPEPGGATFSELLAFIYSIRRLNIVAVDVMEVLPAADVNDITSVAAAKLIREAALLFGKSRGPDAHDPPHKSSAPFRGEDAAKRSPQGP